MSTIIVEHEKVIGRPVDVVRTQFSDIQHHIEAKVHRQLQFSELEDSGAVCRFKSIRSALGMKQHDNIELERTADGAIVITVVAGFNRGTVLRQTFEAQGPQRTLVRSVVSAPVGGWMRLLTPLIRWAIQQDLVTGLEEDRVDLEERGYEPRAAQ